MGSTYRYVGTGDPLNPPYLPAALLNVWHLLAVSSGGKQRCVNGQKKGQRKAVTFVAATPRRVAEVKQALSFVTADCPYEIWRNVVWAVVSTGWDCAEEMAYDWSQTAPERFCEAAFWVVVNSYDPDNVDPITLGTLFHYAKMGRGSWQLS
jgi:hypothetical protein